jgi:hypothetical protein
MRSSILCRERLDRIQRILARNAGALPVREFSRSFSVYEWEIEQAAALGWIHIAARKLLLRVLGRVGPGRGAGKGGG